MKEDMFSDQSIMVSLITPKKYERINFKYCPGVGIAQGESVSISAAIWIFCGFWRFIHDHLPL